MKLKKIIVAILAAFVVSNILTTLWYLLTDSANFVSFRREEMNYVGLVINHLIYAGIFVYLFSFYYEKSPRPSRAFLYGLLMGAIMFVPSGIVVRSIWTVEFNSIFLLNSIAHMVIGGAMGLSTSVIYNYKNQKV